MARSVAKGVARHRWLFWLHAGLLIILAILLFLLEWLMRNLLIGTFAGIFLLMITGFFVTLASLVESGAALGAFLDREAIAWFFVVLAVAGVFVGVFLFVSPSISIERLCFFVSIHALALGFLETRLAQRLRGNKPQQESLRGFAMLSTAFVVLLLMGAIYGERFSVLILAAYCVFFAVELVVLPVKLHKPQAQQRVEEIQN